MTISNVKDGYHYLHDTLAPNNCGLWRVRLDTPQPGLIIEALDDGQRVYDTVELRRFGAYIVLERPHVAQALPREFAFLEPIIELRRRAQASGVAVNPPPLLVHSSKIEHLYELQYIPHAATMPSHGRMQLFGIDVVWHQDLDRFAVSM